MSPCRPAIPFRGGPLANLRPGKRSWRPVCCAVRLGHVAFPCRLVHRSSRDSCVEGPDSGAGRSRDGSEIGSGRSDIDCALRANTHVWLASVDLEKAVVRIAMSAPPQEGIGETGARTPKKAFIAPRRTPLRAMSYCLKRGRTAIR